MVNIVHVVDRNLDGESLDMSKDVRKMYYAGFRLQDSGMHENSQRRL